MKRTLKAFLILVVLNIIIIPVGFMLDWADIAILFISVCCIAISLVILVLVFFAERRNAYLSKNTDQRRSARKRTVIILSSFVVLFVVIFIIASFANGYKIPQSDRHKDWSHFPGSSNANVALDSVTGLFVRNITKAEGTDHYLIYYTNSNMSYYDSLNGPSLFGIMDSSGNMKVKYPQEVDAFVDDKRLIVIEKVYDKDADSCDVYNTKTLEKIRQKIFPINIPAAYEQYPENGKPALTAEEYKKKYGSAFFDSLKGVKAVEEGGYNGGSNYRGYILYTDPDGKLYQIKGDNDYNSLPLLCKDCDGYKLKEEAKNSRVQTENIKMLDESIIWKNDLNSGLSIGYGNPNGNGNDGFYFSYYQTWLMYYKIEYGTVSTSFKAKGGAKNSPYLWFKQLNKPTTAKDTLCFAADNRLWKVYVKKKFGF